MDHAVTRHVWCGWSRREVEVEFLARGVPGFRSPAGVRRCSAFEPADAIECPRVCLDSTYRRPWEAALPPYGARG